MADRWDDSTILIDWKDAHGFTLSEASQGVFVCGSTGSGKSSGPLSLIARSYFKNGFGACVLIAKSSDTQQWLDWAAETGRARDIRRFDAGGAETFDFLSWQVAHSRPTGAQVINTVELLEDIATVAGRNGATGPEQGDNAFFRNALHLHISALVSLAVTSGEPVTVPRLRELAGHAARSPEELRSKEWQDTSPTARLLARLAEEHERSADPERRADIAEIFAYWTGDVVALSSRTRSVIEIMLSMTFQPFLYSPLRKLFTSGASTVTPQDCFDGKIVLIDLAAQQYKLAGIIASLVWKKCMQSAVLSRSGPRGTLRPVALIADEYQLWATPGDADYQATCRANRGCSVYLTQQRESLTRILGHDTTENLLSNLQTKFVCQSTGATATYFSTLIGARYTYVTGTGYGDNLHHDPASPPGATSTNTSVHRNEQMRAYLEPSFFHRLKKGGADNQLRVEAVVRGGSGNLDRRVEWISCLMAARVAADRETR